MNESLNILLVEDDPDDVFFFSRAVRELNIACALSVAANCREFLALLEARKDVDLVFMDINMPQKDGRECLKELKSIEEYRNVPVITFTGSRSERDIDDMYALGAHYHIIKPFSAINYKLALKTVFGIDWKKAQPPLLKKNFVIDFTYT